LKPNKLLHIAIPCLDELNYIDKCLNSIDSQKYKNYKVYICVNQPDEWWSDEDKIDICRNNTKTLEYLKQIKNNNLEIIDKSSKGKGWENKKKGVGYARKELMDFIAKKANDEDIIVSLDADTTFNENYFDSINYLFQKYPDAVALSNPYYHNLTDNDDIINRSILRYEIYMRHYAIKLWEIGSPYSFTALGSAISVPIWAYKAIGGISPKNSGEDFYFLQQLRKYGKIINYNTELVYPATRYSNRVVFGTGPALIKGIDNNWKSYPIYDENLFNDIKKLYSLFETLFDKNEETPLDNFIENQFKDKYIWDSLRKNYKSKNQFVKACFQKIDGLRILQYLKSNHNYEIRDEQYLKQFLEPTNNNSFELINELNFFKTSIKDLNFIRDLLKEIEIDYQKNYIFDNCNLLK